jgi:uncharacterized protein involved in exopolysaccharide biosynthesis
MDTLTHNRFYGTSTNPESLSFIDPADAWRVLRRRRRVFALAALLGASMVLAAYILMPRSYKAMSQVGISTDQDKLVDTSGAINRKAPDSYSVETQVQILKSRATARAVVNRLKLYDQPEFVGAPALSSGGLMDDGSRRERAVSTLLQGLRVERPGLSYVISITYSSPDPATASKVANAMAEQFVSGDLKARAGATTSATRELQQRVNDLKMQLQEREHAVETYRAANGLLGDSFENQSQVGALSGLEAELAQARSETALQAGRSAGAASATSDLLTRLRAQQAETDGELAELHERYGEKHPAIQQALKQKSDIEAQVAQEQARIDRNLRTEASSNGARAGALSASIAQARGRIAAQNQARSRLAELEREAAATRTLYQSYLSRLRETTAQRGLEKAGSKIVSLSTAPTLPSSPDPRLFAALGLLAALGSGVISVAMAQASDRSVRTTEDLERLLGIPVLASIPDFRSSLERRERGNFRAYEPAFVVNHPKSGFAESFRILRSAVPSRGQSAPQVIAITSSLPREGKSSLAASFARVAALDGIRTLLVECDTRKIGGGTRSEAHAGTVQVMEGDRKSVV